MKQRIIAFLAGVALLLAVAGASGIITDSLGYSLVATAHACEHPGGSGGC